MNKKQVVNVLEGIATYLEIKGENSFKISAYRKAAQALEADDRSMEQIDDPTKLPGIGKGTAQVINELLLKGESSLLLELKEEIPEGLMDLLQLPGLGGKKIAKLYQDLAVVDLDSLRKACEQGQVSQLAGFGKKTEEKILASLESHGKRPERLPIAYMLPFAEMIETILKEIPYIQRFSRAGSLRRYRETMKDLDFVIATDYPDLVTKAIISNLNIDEVIGSGETKLSVVLQDKYHVGVDFRFVEQNAYATTLHHFTGSKDHNVKLRQLAKARHQSISEYGVYDEQKDQTIQFDSEKAFFSHFGLHEIPPEVREGKKELERAQNQITLVEQKDIQADLHMHTTWSDGAHTVFDMAKRARELGYKYIAITDHSQSLRVANGLTPERLRKQREEIRQVNQMYPDLKVFAGVEMDILPDGRLDYKDEFLAEMDFVIAAIHTSFSQATSAIMKRLEVALRNPFVNLIAHPTGRVIGRRPGYSVDVPLLIDMAKETGTALELNANPHRLDLAAEWVELAQEKGVNVAINTDAHSLDMLQDMKTGVSVARKGWINKDTVINTWSLDQFNRFLKTKRY